MGLFLEQPLPHTSYNNRSSSNNNYPKSQAPHLCQTCKVCKYPSFTEEEMGSERLSHLPKVPQLTSNRARICLLVHSIQTCLIFPSPDPHGGGVGNTWGFRNGTKARKSAVRPGPRSHYTRRDRISPVLAP